MTPSDAHDSAWRRPPEHDRMTLEVLRAAHLAWAELMLCGPGGSETTATLWDASAEELFEYGRGRMWFADIALHYQRPARADGYREPGHTRVLEIKPKIHSAGAVLRQLKVQQHHAQHTFLNGATCRVIAVVRAEDPLAQLLADLGGEQVCTWDGLQFGWLEPTP